MLVVRFAGGALQAGLIGAIGGFDRAARSGDEFHLGDKLSTPGLIDAGAEFPRHGFELTFPILTVGGNFEAAAFTSQWAGVSGKHFADDAGPRACEPRDDCFRAFQPADSIAQNISGFVHGEWILPRRRKR